MSRERRKKRAKERKAKAAGWGTWPLLTILVLLGILAYWNSFDAPMVFDDLVTIERNAGVRFGDYFNVRVLGTRPLLYLTFATNYALHSQRVWGYHLVNLVFHLINGLLVFFIAAHVLRRFVEESKSNLYAVLAAGFFLLHPVQTESVTYISSRSELLSTIFFSLAILVFVKAPEHRIGFGLSLFVSAFFFMGILSKETVISLPAILFLYDYLFRSGARFRTVFSHWRFYTIFVAGAVSIGYYLLTVRLAGSVGGQLAGHLTPWHYFLTQLRVIVRYIQVVLVPVGLNLDYDFVPSTSPLELKVLLSAGVLLGLVALAWYLRKQQPLFSLSILWFFLTLAPTSSVVPILDVAFEHRLYPAMVGLSLSFPLVVAGLIRFLNEKRSWRLQTTGTAWVLVLILGGLTIARNEVWSDEETLWEDVIEKSPDKSRGYNALAMYYFETMRFDEALDVTQGAMKRMPGKHREFVDTLGNIYLRTGRLQEAADAFGESARISEGPFASWEHNNHGVAYLHMWKALQQQQASMSSREFESEKARILGKAKEAFAKSIEISDGTFTALDSFVNVSSWLGEGAEVQAEHAAILADESLGPKRTQRFYSEYVLGKLAFNDGDFHTAIEHFERGLAVNAGQRLAWFNYAYARERLGRVDDAVDAYLQGIRIDPLFYEAHHNVGMLYSRKKEFETAIEHFEEVLRMFPDHVPANRELAKVYIQTNQPALARRHLNAVLAAEPGNSDAMMMLQGLGS